LNTQGEIVSEAGLSSAKAIELGDLIGNPAEGGSRPLDGKKPSMDAPEGWGGVSPPTHYFLWHSLHFVGAAVPFAAIALWQV